MVLMGKSYLFVGGLMMAAIVNAGQLSLSPMFGDHMVLQRDMDVPVWGKADPGMEISVEFAGKKAVAVADGDGRWRTVFGRFEASDEPREMTVSADGADPIVVGDMLVGEVWLCSGQSNMQFELDRADGAAEMIATSENPRIRLFQMQGAIEFEPQKDMRGKWMPCNPETTPKFSAIAYLFGRDIESRLQVPIGLVHASQGWTPGEAWMSRESLMAEPSLRYLVEAWDKATADFPRLSEEYKQKMAEWQKAADAAKEQGAEPPPQPQAPVDPHFLHRASGFYNGCIAPIAGLAMRGVIWYQGETNEVRGHEYRVLFPALIKGWREAWGRDFPFLFVQVAAVLPPDPEPVPSEWAELRESQALTAQTIANTAMACTIDIGEQDDVHPKNKLEAARRLALTARSRVYGERIVDSGPTFKDAKFADGKAVVSFDNIADGLVAKGGDLATFQIAGDDRKFVYASAKIDGDKVVVWSDAVAAPVAVRYAWNNNPEGCNLYNTEGLPCVPFRSDDWPCKTLDSHRSFITP